MRLWLILLSLFCGGVACKGSSGGRGGAGGRYTPTYSPGTGGECSGTCVTIWIAIGCSVCGLCCIGFAIYFWCSCGEKSSTRAADTNDFTTPLNSEMNTTDYDCNAKTVDTSGDTPDAYPAPNYAINTEAETPVVGLPYSGYPPPAGETSTGYLPPPVAGTTMYPPPVGYTQG
eukprot:TRINITY_DN113658_c0_g1_i1.p1 TRINITY_DN113658_c0_g1~~TRINITY_DN113658_c0_g1_i1.p1  ORF type:complete len:173 (-),score=18.84 TRINITY_DN113658_c0_g1_i1:141-659(-)